MSLKSSALGALAALAFTAPAIAQSIDIYDPYARSATPMAKTGAVFMMIHNTGNSADRLIGVTTPAAKMAQLHTHRDQGGVMKMVHVEEGFAVPAGETVFLERGGKHVMLMGLSEPFEQGKTIPLTLVFEQTGEIEIEVPVDLARKAGHGHGQDN